MSATENTPETGLPDDRDDENGSGERPERKIDDETRQRRDEALARIVQFGSPILKSRASDVTSFDDALAGEIEEMAVLMEEALGVGLAAPQVGRLQRLLVFQPELDEPARELVNPVIEAVSEETDVVVEGCLSIPKIQVEVERPVAIRVRGQDRHGEELFIETAGFGARVIQHEIDHLDGILILDRTVKEQRRAALRALRRGEAFSPPDPEDDDSDPEERE